MTLRDESRDCDDELVKRCEVEATLGSGSQETRRRTVAHGRPSPIVVEVPVGTRTLDGPRLTPEDMGQGREPEAHRTTDRLVSTVPRWLLAKRQPYPVDKPWHPGEIRRVEAAPAGSLCLFIYLSI